MKYILRYCKGFGWTIGVSYTNDHIGGCFSTQWDALLWYSEHGYNICDLNCDSAY